MTDVVDIKAWIRDRPMGAAQVLAIALCVVINMMDGFDILASGFTAPAIGRDWLLRPTQLGVLFSAGLAGMTVGALVLSPLADFWGRRRTVLLCLVVITVGMLAAAAAPNLWSLVAARVITGVGVAAMMATINTVTAEYANARRRDLAVVIQGAGFPLGGALGGVLAYQMADLSWRWVFAGGAALSLVLMAAAAAWLPESIDFLLARRPKNALERLNRILARLKRPALDHLPEPVAKTAERGAGAIIALAPRTALICAAFFCLMVSLYFLNSWTPKLLTDYGYSTRAGVSGSIFMNLGGATGNLVFAALTLRWGAGRLSPVFLVACFAAAVAFALAPARLEVLTPMAFVLGALLFGSMGSLYAIVPALFPAAVRTSGTGLSLGIGRIGATIGPYVGGVLIGAGLSRAEFGTAMAAPLLLSALAAWALGRRADLKV